MSDPPREAPPPDDAPVVLDERYTIVRTLGEGGMGRVFEGIHNTLDKQVAIKVLHEHHASDDRTRQRLLREARAAASIHHPNVVEIIDFGETPDGSVYLVMELLHGQDLAVILREEGPLPWPRVHNILRQVAVALQAAHEQGIVHRDIKPGNCYVIEVADEEVVERIKLLDFGIAKVDEGGSAAALTATGELLGTATYMAPELTFGAPANFATDMYALGIMAYELLTGAPPFAGASAFAVLRCHLEDPPVPLREHVPEIPTMLEAVVLRALAKKPEERFESLQAFAEALQELPAPPPRRGAAAARVTPAPQASMGPMGTERLERSGIGVDRPGEAARSRRRRTTRMSGPEPDLDATPATKLETDAGNRGAPAPGSMPVGSNGRRRVDVLLESVRGEAPEDTPAPRESDEVAEAVEPRRGLGLPILVLLLVAAAVAVGGWLLGR